MFSLYSRVLLHRISAVLESLPQVVYDHFGESINSEEKIAFPRRFTGHASSVQGEIPEGVVLQGTETD